MSCAAHPQNDAIAPCGRCGVEYCENCLVLLRDERVCASCKGEVVRDIMSGTAVMGLPLARISSRGVAWLLDRLLILVPQMVFNFWLLRIIWKHVPGIISAARLQTVVQLLLLIAYVIYEGAMVARRGQTLGKMALRLQVVGADGASVTRRQAWIRAGFRFALALLLVIVAFGGQRLALLANPMIIAVALSDYLPGLITSQRTTLHDLIARTRVIRLE
jgi:uncharacterized RDD family membrane protein YckC